MDREGIEEIKEPVGETGLPHNVDVELSDLIARLDEKFYFKHGATAAFYHVAVVLHQHLGKGRQ